ncbi:MAG: glycosyltransferase family 39 protein [Candidatus Synoicihabitans palmerolidicus]|nr:glycosyltransferase family 39 protein [Candidatus Synoicihabitans palmerolidicus]
MDQAIAVMLSERARQVGQAVKAEGRRAAAFGLSALAAVGVGFSYFTPAEAGELVRQYGYYAIPGTLLWFGVMLRHEMPDVSTWMRNRSRQEWRWLLGLVGALCVVAWATFPFGYKILYDELVLQATSWNLHKLREVGTMVRGYEIEGVFLPMFVYLDKRPYFFALVVSLVHDLTGFRESNAFLFNAGLLPVVLGLFYAIARRVSSAQVAWAGLACFGASPLLAQNANGAGMDLLNLLMVLLSMLLAARYLERPNAQRLSVLLLACVLLAQTRYESLLFVMITVLVVIEGWRRAGKIILPVTAMAAPLLLVPSALHNSYLSGTPVLWELKENMDSRFNWEHIWPNLGHAVNYFFNFGTTTLGSWWLSLVAFPSLGWLGCRAVKRWRTWDRLDPTLVAVGAFGLAIIANLSLLMAYFWGQLNDPIVSRLILPFTVLMGVAVVMALKRWDTGNGRLAGWIASGALISYLGWGLPATEYHRNINQLATELAREQRAVSRMAPLSRLILTDKTTLGWLMKGIPALVVDDAESRAEQIQFHLDHGTFKEVLLTQRYRPISPEGGFEMDPRDVISDRFVLEPVWERMQGARLVRISRVIEIKPKIEPEEEETIKQSEREATADDRPDSSV